MTSSSGASILVCCCNRRGGQWHTGEINSAVRDVPLPVAAADWAEAHHAARKALPCGSGPHSIAAIFPLVHWHPVQGTCRTV